jgi:cytochrome c oxidase subunit I+III
VPVDSEVKDNVTWWAGKAAAGADGTLYASLLFGGLYLALVAPNWDGPMPSTNWLPATGLVTALAGSLLAHRARRKNAQGDSPFGSLLCSAVLSALTMMACVAGLVLLGDATVHANFALRFALFTYCAVHAAVALLIAAHAAWRWRQGYVSAVRATDIRLTVLWTDYAAVALIPAWALMLLLAGAGGLP